MAITMVLAVAVLGIVGTFLFRQIAEGLVVDRQNVAMHDAWQQTLDAKEKFESGSPTDALAGAITAQLSKLGEREVILTRTTANRNQSPLLTRVSSNLAGVEIPAEVRAAVDADLSQHLQVMTVPSEDGTPVSAVIVGQQIVIEPKGEYGLYFIYPMTRERDTIDLIGRWFKLGGALLGLLLGGVALVASSLVVNPVREAAATAQRFAVGRFSERMRVHGDDDLASLATSFNLMAASIQRQIGQLEDLSRVQQRFTSDVSHELRTPLTTIRMAVDMIHDARDDFDPSVKRAAELLSTQLDRFEELLADLLEISRFDAGAANLEIEPVDVRSIVGRVVDATEPLAERRGSLVTVTAPSTPVIADVDSRRVERILRNLLVNAIEHGEANPIDIHVGGNRSAVAVTVRDHGVGLAHGEAEMVFTRFWRADPARARTTGGTGLGLSISLEDARLHDGILDAWGARGEGSCFRLVLPRRHGLAIEAIPLPLGPQFGAEYEEIKDPKDPKDTA